MCDGVVHRFLGDAVEVGFGGTIHYGILPIDQNGLKDLSGQAVSPL